MSDLDTMPGHLIRRAQQAHQALFAEACGAFDLTSVQYAALAAIRGNPDVDATRLSALIAFDRSTIADVLARLESKGWVLRHPSRKDRRVKLLRLSPDGTALLEQVDPLVREVQERLLAPLDPGDRDTLMRLLTRLVAVHGDALSVPLHAAE